MHEVIVRDGHGQSFVGVKDGEVALTDHSVEGGEAVTSDQSGRVLTVESPEKTTQRITEFNHQKTYLTI